MSALYNLATSTCTNTLGTCAINSSSIDMVSMFYSSANVPLSSWDFTNVWRELPDGFPELR